MERIGDIANISVVGVGHCELTIRVLLYRQKANMKTKSLFRRNLMCHLYLVVAMINEKVSFSFSVNETKHMNVTYRLD